jgi:hypothetical protein
MDSYDLGRFPPLWREWNGKYRDTMRDFWRSTPVGIGEFATRFAGSSDLYGTSGRRPTASVNLITVHDGFTLRDLVSYGDKHNEDNGEDNRDGTSDNRSWNGGTEGPTADPGILSLRARQSRAMLTTLMLSFGVPLLLGGDEMGRTQQGNNNAYCQDNEITWFDWASADTALKDFTKNLIALRRAHPVFRRRRFLTGVEATQLQWFTPAGTPMDGGDWADPGARAIAIYLDGSDAPDRAEDGTLLVDDDFLVLVNSWWEPLDFALPDTRPQARWRVEIDSYDPATPSRLGLARLWSYDQDLQAEDEDPGREHQLHPGRYPDADQQDQRADQAGQDEPPGHDRGTARDVDRGEREHRRHPHRVDVQQAPGEVAVQLQDVWARLSRRGRDGRARNGRGHEQHADEQQAAAQEHGGEQAVLALADPVPQHPDEPQEGDPGERDQVQGDGHRRTPPGIGQPRAGHFGMGRDRDLQQHQRRDQEHGKDNPGDRGSLGCPQRAPGSQPSPARHAFCHPDWPSGGRSSTCRFVMFSRIPSSIEATALTGMATCLRPHRWPSSSRM